MQYMNLVINQSNMVLPWITAGILHILSELSILDLITFSLFCYQTQTRVGLKEDVINAGETLVFVFDALLFACVGSAG